MRKIGGGEKGMFGFGCPQKQTEASSLLGSWFPEAQYRSKWVGKGGEGRQ